MRTRLVSEIGGLRTFAVVLDTGDEVMACLKEVARSQAVTAAGLTAIGAFRRATVSYFDWDEKKYLEIPVDEQVEVASLVGDVAVDESGAPSIHVHLVLGRRDGSALAGHLVRAEVRPTLEIVLTETPAHLVRRHDPRTGLALLSI